LELSISSTYIVVPVRSEVDFSGHQIEEICKINAFIAAIKLADLDPALDKVELDQEEIEGYRLESQSILKVSGRLAAYLCLRRIANIIFGALEYEIKANTARRNSSLVTSKAENDKVRVVFLVRSARGRQPVIYFLENLQK
jgi:hypothetical protein